MLAKNLYYKIEAKTANYQIVPGDIGKLFTNTGATAAITITLPVVTDLTAGWSCRVFATTDFGVTVASQGSNDNLAAFNDAAADSVALVTSNEIIGSGFEFIWDGTNWLVFASIGQDSATITVA